MTIIDLSEKDARMANPSAPALGGFDIQQELKKALRKALKPIEPKVRAYLATKAEIQSKIDRWSPESFDRKLQEMVKATHAGDAAATAELEAGNGPARETFKRLCTLAWQEMDEHERNHRAMFSEAAGLIEQPMHAVVAKGQRILDATLAGLGVPKFTLQGATNGVDYLVHNLKNAGRGDTADLQQFWEALG